MNRFWNQTFDCSSESDRDVAAPGTTAPGHIQRNGPERPISKGTEEEIPRTLCTPVLMASAIVESSDAQNLMNKTNPNPETEDQESNEPFSPKNTEEQGDYPVGTSATTEQFKGKKKQHWKKKPKNNASSSQNGVADPNSSGKGSSGRVKHGRELEEIDLFCDFMAARMRKVKPGRLSKLFLDLQIRVNAAIH